MTAALEALATRLTTLETDLAGAATAAEVTALQTALAAAQADLTELLASNNVYSDNLTINSAATLAVAKNLGGKLAIINGDVSITQSSSLDATELQEVLDVMVTVTGDITYNMAVNSSTQATFDNLTSVTDLTLDVAGDINFPVLENAGVVTLNTTHKNYVTSVEFPVLSSVTSFYTGTDADAIDFPKATAVTLSALKNYEGVASDLTIGGKLNFVLDLAALTSKKASGAKNAIDLTIKGAAEVSLPEFTEGKIIANTSAKVVLPKFKGSGSDSFTKATYLHLAAYEHGIAVGSEVSTSLDTLLFTGVVATGEDNGPSLDLTGATGLSTLTVDGTINTLDLDGTTSLSEVSLSGKANAVIVKGASSLEVLTLDHTAADAELASLSVTGNESLSSLTVSALVSAKSLTITDNDSLETLEFTALKTQGGESDDAASINISDNNLTASSIEMTVAPTSTDKDGTGSIETESGLDTLETYIAAAATRYAAEGGSIYVAFDTVEVYTGVDGEPSTSPIEWSATSTPAETVIVDLKPATTTGDAAVAAVRSIIGNDVTTTAIAITGVGVDAESVTLKNGPTGFVKTDNLITDATNLLANVENKTLLDAAGYTATAAKHWSGSAFTSAKIGTSTGTAYTTGDQLVAGATIKVEIGSKNHTIVVPAATSTATIYGITMDGTNLMTDAQMVTAIAKVVNDMDNSQFDSDTYSATATLSTTTDLGKYTASVSTQDLVITPNNENPLNGFIGAVDITVTGANLHIADTPAGANLVASGTKARVADMDYDGVIIKVTAKNAGTNYNFSVAAGTDLVQFNPANYDGLDGKIYVASTTTTSFDTYILANGAVAANFTEAAKATAPAVNKENLDNYPRGTHVVAKDSTLEDDEAAGTKNYSAWL